MFSLADSRFCPKIGQRGMQLEALCPVIGRSKCWELLHASAFQVWSANNLSPLEGDENLVIFKTSFFFDFANNLSPLEGDENKFIKFFL